MLQQLLTTWAELSPTRKIAAIASVAVTSLAVLLLVRLATAPGYALLYGNLEHAQAGEVVSALDRQSVQYEVRGNAIYVEEGRRDELRVLLATEGLPTSSLVGYELLDQLTGFGTTSQMFDAAYARAIEGELARTITASAFVREARVHVARQGGSAFNRDQTVSASVFARPKGAGLSEANAKALKFLVSSGISGLSARDVTIIDANTGTIVDDTDTSSPSRQSSSKSKDLQSGVKRLLEAHVGRGNAMVEVNLETITDSESIVERRFDPEGQVAVSTDTQEINRSSSGPANGAVTVASNVPSGDAAGGAGESQSQDNEIRERTNFEVSEVQREVRKVPGAIKRLSVAVLVNGLNETNNDGDIVWRPRTDEELGVLRDLVQSAVGYREDRGDVVTIKSLQFEPLETDGSYGTSSPFEMSRLDIMTLIQLAVLSTVVLLLGLFVVRPVLLNRGNVGTPALTNDDLAAAEPSQQGLIASVSPTSTPAESDQLPSMGDFDAPMAVVEDFDFDGTDSVGADDTVGKLKEVIEARQPDTVEILRSWLETSETEEEFA